MVRGKTPNWANDSFDDMETVARPSLATDDDPQPVPLPLRTDPTSRSVAIKKPGDEQPQVTFETTETTNDFGDSQTTAARPRLLPKVEFHYHDDEPQEAGEDGAAEEDAQWASYTQAAAPASLSDSERLTRLTSLIELMHSGLSQAPEPPEELTRLEQEVGSVAAMLAELGGLPEGSAERARLTGELGSQLGRMEALFLQLERRVSLPWLRAHLDALSEPSLVYYARLHLQQLAGTPHSWARIDLAATRLACERSPDGGGHVLRPIEQIAPLWASCLPPWEAEPRVRRKAKTYFVSCAGRLRGLRSVAELFRSGVYADIISYKLSLGSDFFDPRILHASAKLNVAVDVWLAGHPAPPAHELEEWARAALDTVTRTLRADSHGDEALAAIRERMRTRSRATPAVRLPPLQPPQLAEVRRPMSWLRKLIAAAGIAALAAVGVPMALALYSEKQRDMQPLGTAEAKQLHAILQSGSLGGEPAAVLIATLDPEQWEPLAPTQRREAVDTLQKQLAQRGIHQVLLYHRDVLAVNVVDGQIISLE